MDWRWVFGLLALLAGVLIPRFTDSRLDSWWGGIWFGVGLMVAGTQMGWVAPNLFER